MTHTTSTDQPHSPAGAHAAAPSSPDEASVTSESAEPGKPPRSPDFVQSLERGLQVLKAFGPGHPKLTLADVSRVTGINRAAARRFLLTLQDLGYVAHDGKFYALRSRVLELGYAYLSSKTLPEVAQDELVNLSGELHESSSAAVLDGHEIMYVARASTSRIMSVTLALGTKLPAAYTSMGRMLLASLDDEALDAYLAGVTLTPVTSRSISTTDELRTELLRIRTAGYALIDQELEIGVRSVAVPVRSGGGSVVAAMNISAHASRVSMERLEHEFLPRLRDAARSVETMARRAVR